MKDSILKKLKALKTELSLDDLMTFGKYGKRFCLEYVIENDPSYIDWLIFNKPDFKMDREAQIRFTYVHERYLEEQEQNGRK